MTRSDYKFVTGDTDKIILDGGIMPVRKDEEDKTKFRGEDICFLLEAGVRFHRVTTGFTRVREFSRKLLASQAKDALNQVSSMFQTGYAIKTLPTTGACYNLGNIYNYDYMSPFDVLAVNDCEPMTPIPESGSLFEAAPFRAAFRNLQKVKGQVASTRTLPSTYPVDKIVIAQENSPTLIFGYTPSEIYYSNSSIGPRKMPDDPDIIVDPNDYARSFQQTLTTPVSAGDEYIPDYYGQAGYLKGCRCLSGTIWQVRMFASLSWDGRSYSTSGAVLSLDDNWIPSSDGKFTMLSCSSGTAMGILGKVCNFLDSGLWSKVTGNYNSIGVDEVASCYASANAVRRIGIAEMDDCLRESLDQ